MLTSNWKLTALAGLGLSFGLANATDASLLVYEGFQYGTPGANQVTNTADPNYNLLDGQADGVGGDIDATGLSGVWVDSLSPGQSSNLFLSPGSLAFGDLPTSGNHVRSDTNSNNDIYSRSVTADLDSGSKLYFSFLGNMLQNNFSAAEEGIAITNQTVSSAQLQSITAPAGLQGFGISPDTNGNNWSGWAWDGTSRVDVGGTYVVPTNGSQTDLLIGEISFGTGSGGTDEFSVYYYTLNAGSIAGGTLTQIGSTLEVNVDETTLDTLNVTRQVNTAFDEIRIGTTLDDVLGVPEPSSLALLGLGGLLIARRRRD